MKERKREGGKEGRKKEGGENSFAHFLCYQMDTDYVILN
jgi:hypothetical protein